MQVHGGLCFTWEHPAHLYFRRAKAGALLWGDAQQHRELLVTRLGGRPRAWATPAAAAPAIERIRRRAWR